ncbi:MAG: class I mannose-6-phosphate isomerase [Clostridiales bacterium]|nr:class I mannose-6-phosphate isomerase [Clostridiales bacterium]MBR6485003.1 class I mannose-6-phosphate isomerase [Clostridiales bacterium]
MSGNEKIIKLSASYKGYIWGGRRLIDDFGMDCGLDRLAEAWLVSAHPEGQSSVISGKDEGMIFGDYIEKYYPEITKKALSSSDRFPLLVKLLDAQSDLSVQVHPDNEYGLANDGQPGKSEMWLILDSAPGAGIYVGFKQDMTEEEVISAVEDGTVLEKMNFYPTSKGEVYFIPVGTVHAIGAGNLICEVQNSSTCTYRLFDYKRTDKDGNMRELHLDKALAVMNYSKFDAKVEPDGTDTILRCDDFICDLYEVSGSKEIETDPSRFDCLICVRGCVSASAGDSCEELSAGQSAFVAPGVSKITLTGDATVVLCHT